MNPKLRWALRHAWSSDADLAALQLCREQLASVGIEFVDADRSATPDATKMHGMEMVDARASDAGLLLDLSAVAQVADWEGRLSPSMKRYMRSGTAWHGIPIGIHRVNTAWTNAAIARSMDTPTSFGDWHGWLRRVRPLTGAPLAVGKEPWQVALLFENAVLSVAGIELYRQAFVDTDVSVWRGPRMREAVDAFLGLRDFVSDEHLDLTWSENLARVERGEAALTVMGDWARACVGRGVLEQSVPGTAGKFLAVFDYFVPLNTSTASTSNRVALALSSREFQRQFALIKGNLPAMRDAWADVDPLRAAVLNDEAAVAPSMTLDQCCSAQLKQELITVVADHFVNRLGVSRCTAALSSLTRR